ncbi:MAG: SDR family oxidoreductase, partial [Myxococcales bacterium]|nr:SDR family oxidoreductase [Myxococcales bacterium]
VAGVRGGAGAVGVGVARQLLDAGAHVLLTDVDEAGLRRAEEVLGRSEALVTTRLDVTSSEGVAAGFDVACRAFGGVDLVVANAGIAVAGSTIEIDDDAWSRASEVNLGGVQRTVREAAIRMRDQGVGGDIVVISTKNVAAPGAGLAAYSVTKAAAHQLARVAAVELAPFDIRVNLVAPDAVFSEGGIPSGLWAELGPDRARRRSVSPELLQEFYRDRNLLKSTVTGSDVGRAVVFFASRHTPTTGAVLPVDGGLVGAFPR